MRIPKTFCVNCRYFLNTSSIFKRGNKGVWYDHFCTHPEFKRRKSKNPVTGITVYVDNMGHEGEKYPYARNINHGNCSYYEN